MVNKKNIFRFGSLLLASALLAACGSEAAPPAPQPTPVTVVTLKTEPVALTRELPGRTNPYRVAEVRPQVNGIVEDLLFTEGGVVEAGEALYQLDDATYQADVNSAEAVLARAEATLEFARLDAERAAGLAKTGAISAQENENAIAALRKAEADVAVARAALDRSKVLLGYARIAAPISGRIGKSTITQGALVTANQATPLATVQQLDPIYVDLTQSASELLELRKALAAGTIEQTDNVPVTILLEDGSRYAHAGKLAFSEVAVDPSTGSFALRVVVPNPDHLLLPGMYVRAVISTAERQNALLVPQQGITRDPKGNATAMVVGSDGIVEQRAVNVSRTIGDQWLVESGLKAGDRVVVAGLQKIRPGAAVVATEAHREHDPDPVDGPADDNTSVPAVAAASTDSQP
ncbi:MAG TPA: efflux RND transporter periplasmic adaptor subunit [Gammaproteobacteria bacterium]